MEKGMIMRKKVVLFGDSIRLIGYGTVLPDMIKDKFDVWQGEDNDRFVQYLFRQLFNYAEEVNSADIVHFNSGQWDICNLYGDGTFTPEDTYISYLSRFADILLKKGKTVVFATTTPVRKDNVYNDNADIERFNKLAVSALKNKGVIINDLYSALAADIEKYIREDDKIHLTEEGIMLAARQTADILNKLE